MADSIIKEEILSLTSKAVSYNIIALKTVNSTNSYAKELLNKGSDHGTVVIADSQTNGRGRLGREFFSPGGTGIYMSVIINPNEINIPSHLLTIAAGVSVCRTLNSICKSSALIKWVNDIFVNGKKVSGILAESVINPKTNASNYIIVGIGINVSTPSNVFPGKLSDIAGSIFPENISRNEIIARLLDEFFNVCNNESIPSLISEYKKYSLVLGKNISFTQNDKAYNGIASDINSEGNLVVTLDNNKNITLKSGEVSLGSASFSK